MAALAAPGGFQAGQLQHRALHTRRPQQHQPGGRDDQRLHGPAAAHGHEDRVLDLADPVPRQVHTQHPGGLPRRIAQRERDVDEAQRLVARAAHQPFEQQGLVHIAHVPVVQRVAEPGAGGHVDAFEHAARGGEHGARRVGDADPRVQGVALLQRVDLAAHLWQVGIALKPVGDQAHLAVALEHGAVQPAAGLVRQLGQVGANARAHLGAGGAVAEYGEQHGEQHRQQREGQGQPGSEAEIARMRQRSWHGHQ
jgi:hypothetical protein